MFAGKETRRRYPRTLSPEKDGKSDEVGKKEDKSTSRWVKQTFLGVHITSGEPSRAVSIGNMNDSSTRLPLVM